MKKLSSRYVGAKARPYQTEITWRQCMHFAAGTGDDNPVYFDDDRPEGILAPPMLSVALTWPPTERTRDFWDAGDFPHDALKRQVHFTETLRWHRPMRPGDLLTIQGEVAAILPHRAGTELVIRYRAADDAGAPVFEEYIGGLLRGVRCADEGRGRENLPPVPSASAQDDIVWEKTLPIHPLAAHVFDACAKVPFPIHTSVRFARSVGLPRTIFQGTATLALAVREIINSEAGSDPAALKSVSAQFTAMVLPGTDIMVRLLERRAGENGRDLFFEVLNGDGKRAISGGHATLHAAGPPAACREEKP